MQVAKSNVETNSHNGGGNLKHEAMMYKPHDVAPITVVASAMLCTKLVSSLNGRFSG
jgi:hypothetical protein